MFSYRSHALVFAFALASLPRVAHAQPSSSSTVLDEEDRRRALYQAGKDAIKAQHWLDARTKLLEAWSMRPSYDVALSLSQAEFNLEHFAESATLLDYYFRNVSAKENKNNLTNAQAAFDAAKAKVSAVSIKAPKGAEVFVEGKSVGIAPLESKVFVLPGHRVFEARAADTHVQADLTAAAGAEQSVELIFPAALPTRTASTPEASPSGTPQADTQAPPVSDVPVEPAHRSLVPAYVGGGVAAVGVGLGAAFLVMASGDSKDLDSLKQRNGTSGCVDGSASTSDCAAQRNAAEAHDRHTTYGAVGLAVGGAAIIGTVTYLLWPQPKTQASMPVKVGGFVAPRDAHVWVGLNF